MEWISTTFNSKNRKAGISQLCRMFSLIIMYVPVTSRKKWTKVNFDLWRRPFFFGYSYCTKASVKCGLSNFFPRTEIRRKPARVGHETSDLEVDATERKKGWKKIVHVSCSETSWSRRGPNELRRQCSSIRQFMFIALRAAAAAETVQLSRRYIFFRPPGRRLVDVYNCNAA